MNTLICTALVVVVATASVLAFTYEEKNMVNYAVGTLGRGVTLVEIVKVDTQVVAGTMYHITVKVRRTLMGGINGGRLEVCKFKLWKKLDGSIKVTESNCKSV